MQSRCVFPLWHVLLLFDPSCLWANVQNIFANQEEEEGALCPVWVVSVVLSGPWRMQVGKQIQLSPGKKISLRESFSRMRNLCGLLCLCSINFPVHIEKDVKIVAYNDPFLCLHALKIINLSLLVQAQCGTELSLPLNNPAVSWLHCSHQPVCEQQFQCLVHLPGII